MSTNTMTTYTALNKGRSYKVSVSDVTYEGWKTYIVDGVPAHCSGGAPDGWVSLQCGGGADAFECFVRISDLPDFRQTFTTPK